MFKNWVVYYFRGGYLKPLYPEVSKKDALSLMQTLTDGYCVKCVKGLFKGQVIYKFKQPMNLLPQQKSFLEKINLRDYFISGR